MLQTSDDGWTCGTPLAALTDDRNAMLAVAMNGKPLPIEHGFPVRTIVPGLYGYVSACKWVVDLEVTRFDRDQRLLDRARLVRAGAGQDVVADRRARARVAEVPPGDVTVGGVAWAQHTGIEAVEIALDGGEWQPAELGRAADRRHVGAVGGHGRRPRRATTSSGCARPTRPARCRPASSADVLPDGATGWHEVDFSAT